MISEIKLRELFDVEFERQKEFIAGLFLMGERERLTIFKWFCLGFQHSYGAPLFAEVRQDMSEERHQQILQALREESKDGDASRKALTIYADEIKESNPTLAKDLLQAIRYESP